MSIIIDNISKIYKTNTETIIACNIDNLIFNEGNFYAIIGPSAAGKSTLLNILALLLKPDSGKIIINGVPILELSKKKINDFRINNIGLMFQDDLFIKELSILENLEIISQLSGKMLNADLKEFIEILGISDILTKLPTAISRGQLQRAALLRALIFNQPIIIADEPTANLDSTNANIIFSLFRQLTNKGKIIIVASHDLNILSFVNHIIKIKDGKLQEKKSL